MFACGGQPQPPHFTHNTSQDHRRSQPPSSPPPPTIQDKPCAYHVSTPSKPPWTTRAAKHLLSISLSRSRPKCLPRRRTRPVRQLLFHWTSLSRFEHSREQLSTSEGGRGARTLERGLLKAVPPLPGTRSKHSLFRCSLGKSGVCTV